MSAEGIVHLAELIGVARQSLNCDGGEPPGSVLCELAAQRLEEPAGDKNRNALGGKAQQNARFLTGDGGGQPEEVEELLVLLVHDGYYRHLYHLSCQFLA